MPLDDKQTLSVPLFGVLGSFGFSHYGNYRHFNENALFWSLTRLYGYYYRVVEALALPREQRPFLEADIEGFIIRMRIVLNDIGYILWQLLPSNRRGLKGPKGNTHPKNREMSILSIAEFLQEESEEFPEFASVLAANLGWISKLKDKRDNVVHYKAKALVIETTPVSFSLVNAAGTEAQEAIPEGGRRLVTTPVHDFVNGQTLSLHNFMHTDLADAFKQYIDRLKLHYQEVGSTPRMACPGIELFKQVNGIHA